MPERIDTVVVVGTGTGVGKTHVSCALLAAARSMGRACVGLKPIETGIGTGPSDGDLLQTHGSVFHVKHPAPYLFAPAVSPHRAAREAGVRIEPAVVRGYVESARPVGATVLVETAGGLFSPLGPGLTNFDVMMALEPCLVVLVAGDRLGVLHDVTATVGLAEARGRRPDVVVLSSPDEVDGSTGTNASELAWLGLAEVAAVFPRANADEPPSLEAARRAWEALARGRSATAR